MLEAHRLVKRYNGVTAIDDISFSVDRGEILGYLGPNGSGKSTTVRILAGLLEPSAGRALFQGGDINADLVGFHARLGYVPEEQYLYSFLSGREQLELFGRLRGLPDELLEHKIHSLTSLFGLGEAIDQAISGYSKGMKQKVVIIAALLHDPEVLIFDEPESGLDVTAALVLRQLVKTLADRGKAIMYSSHVLDVVEKVCSRVVVLHRGRVVAHDSVAELRALMSRDSLEDVYRQLVLRDDPDQIARDIAAVVTTHA